MIRKSDRISDRAPHLLADDRHARLLRQLGELQHFYTEIIRRGVAVREAGALLSDAGGLGLQGLEVEGGVLPRLVQRRHRLG